MNLYLTRMDIEHISNKVLERYYKLSNINFDKIIRIEPCILINDVLGLDIEYMKLSENGEILGLTTLSEVGISLKDDNDQDYIYYLDGKTLLIEKRLCNDKKMKGRLNFTLMHEASHQIIDRLTLRANKNNQIYYYTYKIKSETDWCEWQANTLASALLMPRELIEKGMFRCGIDGKIKCLNRIFNRSEYLRFSALAELLGVSKHALMVRMKYLGLIEKEYFHNPIDYLSIYPEEEVVC